MRRSLQLLLLALGLGFLGLGLTWIFLERHPAPPRGRVHLALGPLDPNAQVTANQRIGLVLLIQDLLETEGRVVVSLAENQSAEGPDVPTLSLQAFRNNHQLRLTCQWLKGQWPKSRSDATDAFADPSQSLNRFLAGFGIAPRHLERLVPRDAGSFWNLLECLGSNSDEGLERRLELSRQLIESDPKLASGYVCHATHTFRKLTLDQKLDPAMQARTEHQFQEALALLPHYPRAAYRFGILLTDSGKQRQAMELLFEAYAHRPHAAHLLSALAYAGRTSGLLDGSLKALAVRDQLLGPQRFTADFVENTYLYAGQWDRFETKLGTGEGESGLTVLRDFYRGYMRVIRQKPEEALRYFDRAVDQGAPSVTFQSLSRVFQLQLRHRTREAKRILDQLKADRARLRAPDGEFTFKLAEAYAFLEEWDLAEDMATRAFSQGFGCTRWYQESPFLKPLQHRRRFMALVQNLASRQHLLERRFPANRFG